MIVAASEIAYLIAGALFIMALYWMNAPWTARRGVYAGVAGTAIAVLVTWAQPAVIHHRSIILATIAGFAVGVPLSRVPLTAVPQRTALSHAFGGAAAGLVGTAEFYLHIARSPMELTAFRMTAIMAEIILGYLTFTGSLMAAGKLQEVKWIPQRPITYPFQNAGNFVLIALAVVLATALTLSPRASWAAALFPVVIVLALLFGVLLILPIGGADMPTVIAILNSYAGLSAVAMGFVLENRLLITAGALDGSSGLILAIIMSRAMNRSFTNVLFGAFGKVKTTTTADETKVYKSETVDGVAQLLEQAGFVVIVPGYGMAVAQAQHKVRELYDQLKRRDITVKFAIHPVAGRMPGHMNVLLAEADIPYTDLVDQSGDAAVRRGTRDRRQRRRQSRCPLRKGQSDLRHADHRGRQGAHRDRHQARQESRICRDRQRTVLHGPHVDVVRGREAGGRRAGQADGGRCGRAGTCRLNGRRQEGWRFCEVNHGDERLFRAGCRKPSRAAPSYLRVLQQP
jgi:proton-translocating NAD(P)+ transhydrogenase subunit beta